MQDKRLKAVPAQEPSVVLNQKQRARDKYSAHALILHKITLNADLCIATASSNEHESSTHQRELATPTLVARDLHMYNRQASVNQNCLSRAERQLPELENQSNSPPGPKS